MFSFQASQDSEEESGEESEEASTPKKKVTPRSRKLQAKPSPVVGIFFS